MNLWPDTTAPPLRLWGVSLITDDVPRLRAFYEALFGTEGEGDDTHVDLAPVGGAGPSAGLALFTTRGMEAMAPGSMAGAAPCSADARPRAVLGLQVEGGAAAVDALHARLLVLGIPVVKPPQTHPWGSRSVWFRDPDGNIIALAAKVERS